MNYTGFASDTNARAPLACYQRDARKVHTLFYRAMTGFTEQFERLNVKVSVIVSVELMNREP